MITNEIIGLNIEYVDSSSVKIMNGICRDSDDSYDLFNGSDITVDLDVSGAGGLDTGSKASSTWYYIWLIYNYVSGVASAIASTSSTTPIMPSGYYMKRRIGAIKTDGGSDIIPFRQWGSSREKEYAFFDAFAVLTDGESETYADVDCSAVVPSTSKICKASFYQTSSNNLLEVRAKNTTNNQVGCIYSIADCRFVFNDVNTMQYKVQDSGTDTASIKVNGFIDLI